MRTATSVIDRQQAREYLTDALALLELYDQGTEDPEHAWTLPHIARVYSELAANALCPKPVPSLELVVKES